MEKIYPNLQCAKIAAEEFTKRFSALQVEMGCEVIACDPYVGIMSTLYYYDEAGMRQEYIF